MVLSNVGGSRIAGDGGDLGLVLGKGALERRHEMLGLHPANGGTPNGVFQVSKNGLPADAGAGSFMLGSALEFEGWSGGET